VVASGTPGELEVAVRVRDTRPSDASSSPEAQRFVLTVTGPDQRGIIHRISSYLASRGISISDFYARVEEGQFVMIIEIDIAPQTDVRTIQDDLAAMGEEMGLSAYLQHENIFIATNDPRPVRTGRAFPLSGNFERR
jgi:predicted amino acid-binding ACT domain protein